MKPGDSVMWHHPKGRVPAVVVAVSDEGISIKLRGNGAVWVVRRENLRAVVV